MYAGTLESKGDLGMHHKPKAGKRLRHALNKTYIRIEIRDTIPRKTYIKIKLNNTIPKNT